MFCDFTEGFMYSPPGQMFRGKNIQQISKCKNSLANKINIPAQIFNSTDRGSLDEKMQNDTYSKRHYYWRASFSGIANVTFSLYKFAHETRFLC